MRVLFERGRQLLQLTVAAIQLPKKSHFADMRLQLRQSLRDLALEPGLKPTLTSVCSIPISRRFAENLTKIIHFR